MQNWLSELKSRLTSPGVRVSNVVMSGTPSPSLLTWMLDTCPDARFSLYETQDEAARELRRVVSDNARVAFFDAFVSQDGNELDLYQFNQKRFNGFHPLAQGQSLLPNVKSIGVKKVKTVRITDVLSRHGVYAGSNDLLVLCNQGSVSTLLSDSGADALSSFGFVVCMATRGVLFEGGQTVESVVETMSRAGFVIRLQAASALYPFEDLLFERDESVLAKREAMTRFKTLEARVNELETELEIALDEKAEALRDVDRERQRSQSSLEDAQRRVSFLESELSQHMQMNQGLMQLTKELQAKILKTEGQLNMVKSLFLDGRNSGSAKF